MHFYYLLRTFAYQKNVNVATTYDLSVAGWIIALLCGMLIGLSKTGVAGIGMLVVPVLALLFGGKPSTGLLLPMLIMADIMAVVWYHKNADWRYVLKPMPWALLGLTIGLLTGTSISDEGFKRLIGLCILTSIAILFWTQNRKTDESIPHTWWYSALFGIVGGFSTMIGNAAGPIMSVYLLSMKLPKNSYIGTTAWFFLAINVTKLPLQAFFWHNINLSTLYFNVLMLPAIVLGAFLGIRFVKIISETHYRMFVIGVTLLSALVLIL